MTRRRRRGYRLNLRREVLILVPAAFFLATLLSIVALLSYRNAVSLVGEERRTEALALARRVAGEIGDSSDPTTRLVEIAPAVRGLAIVSARGETRVRVGRMPDGPLLAPLGPDPGRSPRSVGPEGLADGVVAAFAPLDGGPGGGGGGKPAAWLRVDLAAGALAAQQRTLKVLTWVVLGVDGGLVALMLLFMGHMLAPYESLLERAHRFGGGPGEDEDEVAFLLGTFERALEGLSRPPSAEADEIAVLQRTLGVSLESGVLLLDRAGGVLALNETGAALLGIGRPEPGMPLEELDRQAPGLGPLVELISQAVALEREVRREECRIDPGGPSSPASTLGVTVHPLRRDDGLLRGFLALFADLTEVRRQRQQAQLAESLRQLGELSAGVAHELRNSLATVKGYLTLIDRELTAASDPSPRTEGITESLLEIRREADHLQRVLEDFLSFARPGSTRLEPLDLRAVVERAAADPSLGAVAGDEIAIEVSAPVTIPGDAQLLERALRNLLHNAVQAARSGDRGGVEVAIREASAGAVVEVADRGAGIPGEVRERLFEPFATGRADGVGLGLALAHRIVLLHGGLLELVDRDGGGTIARMTLPRGEIVTEGNDRGRGD